MAVWRRRDAWIVEEKKAPPTPPPPSIAHTSDYHASVDLSLYPFFSCVSAHGSTS
jgi:hypothetical protein